MDFCASLFRENGGGPEKDLCFVGWGRGGPQTTADSLLAARVLGHSLGALTHGVLGQLAGEQETDGRLDLAARDGRPLVVVGQTGRLRGDALEDVIHERIHDRHGLARDASVGVHLLQHLVDVDGVAFLPLPLALLVAGADSLSLAGLLGTLGADFRRHVVD